MSILSSYIKEALEKELLVCKLPTFRYISNISKQDNTYS